VCPNSEWRFPTFDATRTTFSKLKGQRSMSPNPLMVIHIVRHIFRTASPTNFKLGTWMEDDDQHQPQAPWPPWSKVKVPRSRDQSEPSWQVGPICCTCVIRGRRRHTVSAEPDGHTTCYGSIIFANLDPLTKNQYNRGYNCSCSGKRLRRRLSAAVWLRLILAVVFSYKRKKLLFYNNV